MPVDKWDIEKLEWFLSMAKRFGTDVIKITGGEDINTWVIKYVPPSRK